MKRNVGELGESDFKKLCSSIGVSANKSDVDKTGWDFFVEFDLSFDPKDSSTPLDLMSAPLECKVQVKATEGDKKACQIEVSNLVRLVKSPLPAFICFFEYYDTSINPTNVYLVHVNEEIISKVLKRLREITVDKSKRKNLSKKTISIKYGDQHRLSELSGASLKEKIDEYIPPNLEKYTEWKQKLNKEVGYEEGNTNLNIQFNTKDLSSLMDKKPSELSNISFESFQIYDNRFGISVLKASGKRGEGKLSFLFDKKSFHRVCFSSMMKRLYFLMSITSSPFNILFKKKATLFLIHPLFEFSVNLNTGEIHLELLLNSTLKYTLGELMDFGDLWFLIINKTEPVEVSIEGKYLFTLKPEVDQEENKNELTEFFNSLKSLNEIIHKYNFPKHERFNLTEIQNASRAINTIHTTLFKSDPKSMKITLSLHSWNDTPSKTYSIVTFIFLEIGEKLLGFLVSFKGQITQFKVETEFLIERFTVHETIAIQSKEFSEKTLLNKALDLENQLYKETGSLIRTNNKNNFIFFS